MSKPFNWVSHTPSSATATLSSPKRNDSIPLDTSNSNQTTTTTDHQRHRPVSPPNLAEKFFLPIPEGQFESPLAVVARKLKSTTTSQRSVTSESIVTEDFASAADQINSVGSSSDLLLEELDDILSTSTRSEDEEEESFCSSGNKGIYKNDILGLTAVSSYPLSPLYERDEHLSEMASKKKRTVTMKAPTTTTTTSTMEQVSTPTIPNQPEDPILEVSTSTQEDPTSPPSLNLEPISHVYEGAKNIWSFGKNLVIVGAFMGLAESAASKVLDLTLSGKTLQEADEDIKNVFGGVDKDFIDPAILRVWMLISPVIGKGDEVLKGILGRFSKKMIDNGVEDSDASPVY